MDSFQPVSPSLTQPTPSPTGTSSSYPIRAPLSFDSDIETTPLKINTTTSSSSISTSGGSSSDSEHGFVSAGEDEQEEEPIVFSAKEEVGSSDFPPRPKAMLSGDFDDLLGNGGSGSEVEDDEVSSVVRVLSIDGLEHLDGVVVETPKVRVLVDENGDEGEYSNGGFVDNGVLGFDGKEDWVEENPISVSVAAVENVIADINEMADINEVKRMEGDEGEYSIGGFVENSENGVLGFQGNPGSYTSSVAVDGNGAIGVNEASMMDLVEEDLIADNEVKGMEGEETEVEEGVDEKLSEALGGECVDTKTEEESVVNMAGLVEEENEVFNVKALNGESEKVVTEGFEDSKILDLDAGSSGSSPVETNLLGLENGGVGILMENVFEIETPVLAVERSASMGLEFDQALADDVVKVNEASDVTETSPEQKLEALAVSEFEIQGELWEPKDEVKEMRKDNDEKIGVDETVQEDSKITQPEIRTDQTTDLGDKEDIYTSHVHKLALPSSVFVIEGEDGDKKNGVGAIDVDGSVKVNPNTVEPEFRTERPTDLGENEDTYASTSLAQNLALPNSVFVPEVREAEDGDEKIDVAAVEGSVKVDPNTTEPEFRTEQLTDLEDKEDTFASTSPASEPALPSSTFVPELVEAEDGVEEEDNGLVSDKDTKFLMFDGSETAEQVVKVLSGGSGVSTHLGGDTPREHSQKFDQRIVMESDEEEDTDDEGVGRKLLGNNEGDGRKLSEALTAFLKAANGAGSEGGTTTVASSDASRLFSVERPAGLGSSVRSLRSTPFPNQTHLFNPLHHTIEDESESTLSVEEKKKLEKIQSLRVKFLRLVHRLGHSAGDSIVDQVLYRLVLAAGRHTSQGFSLENAKNTAMKLEGEGKDDLDFSLNILVLGKTGVGKSATINSIFGEDRTTVNAFESATTSVKEIIGTVGGVKIRLFDTPGLRASVMEQTFNQKMLLSVKKFTKKCQPDILLYVDRLDSQTRDLNDLPLLRSITNTLGSSIWRSAVLALTHAASAPPDGPSGFPLSYEMFVAQRSHIVQQSIGQALGDLRMMNPSLMNPVSLVENHQSCRKNRDGQKILPNGQSWRSQLLLLCYSLKILSEVSSLSKPQDVLVQRKLFGFRVRSPPLLYFVNSLLQSRAHPKLPIDQGAENADFDLDLEDLEDSEQEAEEDEYDQLPPFKPLRKSQIAKLSKEHRDAYFDEYDYRVRLLQKKQLKEELKRMGEMKKRGKSHSDDYANMEYNTDQENEGPPPVPVPLPDLVLPPSFDSDNPTYRYRILEPTSQILLRPVSDNHGWDHDCGYDGVSLEHNLTIGGQFPAGLSVNLKKDKKEFNIHLDSSIAAKHGQNGSTLAGFDIQTIGKELAYILRGETKFNKLKKNDVAAGISIIFLGETVLTGLKVEDQISIGKRLNLVGSSGAVASQGDVAYGANLEARLKDKDYPFGQDESTLNLSMMNWRGDPAFGVNLQSQFSIGRSSKMTFHVGLNNKLSGQITVRTSSSQHLQIALAAFLPIAISIYRNIWSEAGESYSAY